MIFETRDFDADAKRALADTFDNDGYLAEVVSEKACKVYRVTEDDGDEIGWLICRETPDNFLQVECYQGKDANRVADKLIEAVEVSKMRGLRFYTEKKGMTRILGKRAQVRAYLIEVKNVKLVKHSKVS